MSIQSISGLDHVVYVVRDLDASERIWESLGFTVSPRGFHPPHMGTANHTIMLAEDYIEIVGVLTPTDHNLKSREFLTNCGDGIERAAFTTIDADASAADLRSQGLLAVGPLDFSRPVDLPGGRKSTASFRTVVWPANERPAGMRLFAIQHMTRGTVWIPELTRHPNTAVRLGRMEILSRDPKSAADHMSRLTDLPVETMTDGALLLRTGADRADIIFLDHEILAQRHPEITLSGIPEEGCVTLAIAIADLTKAKSLLAPRATVTGPRAIKIAPAQANGVILELKNDD